MRTEWRALFVLLAVCLIATVAVDAVGATENRLRVDGETVEAEVTFELTSQEPINYWGVSLGLPDEGRVESVRDGLGEIEDYETDDGSLEFRTNTGVARETETVTVEYVVENATVESYADGRLRVLEVSFVGFDSGTDGATSARITAEDTVLSASPTDGFEVDVTERGALYDGEGSATVRVVVGGESDAPYDRYAVFGDADLSEADDLYRVVPATFGFEPTAYKHPVVVLNDTRYDRIAEDWSEAQHRSGGVILLRGSASDHTGAVLHETAHAYNAEALAWSDETVGWFEEGTATYVEFLADRRRGETRRALFTGDRVRDGERVGPRGSVDDLLDYYDGDGFMRTWNTADGDRNRRFGYAFSELVVRSYVKENGATALRETYDELLSTDARSTTAEETTRRILESMDAGEEVLRPCERGSRNRTIDCLRRVNRMDATVPAYDGQARDSYRFDPSALPQDGENGDDSGDGGADDGDGEDESANGGTDDGGGILSFLRELFAGIAEFFRGLFASVTPVC